MRPGITSAYCLVLLLLFAAGAPTSAKAQQAGLEWQLFRPAGEEFQILIPKDPAEKVSKMAYHRMELTTRLYLSGDRLGPVFAVASLSGIKSNPAAYTEFQRLNSYVDAFKNWFPEQIRGKEAKAKLTLVGEKTLNGHTGREYRLTIADLTGSAHVYATRRRFYAVVMLNTKTDADLQERFLSSFVLPEKVIEPPPEVAQQAPPEAPNPAPTAAEEKKPATEGQKAEGAAEQAAQGTVEAKPSESPDEKNLPPGQKRPVNGGVLNGKALYLPKPDYPPNLHDAKVAGSVVIQVTIDEVGAVIAAKAVSGPAVLHQVCINAAMQARFSPTMLMGEPVKVTGVLTYNFSR